MRKKWEPIQVSDCHSPKARLDLWHHRVLKLPYHPALIQGLVNAYIRFRDGNLLTG